MAPESGRERERDKQTGERRQRRQRMGENDFFQNINNIYFDLDTSGVEILKAREIEEIKELYKANLISNGAAIDGLKSIDDKWGNLKTDSELYYSEIDNKMTYDGKTKA